MQYTITTLTWVPLDSGKFSVPQSPRRRETNSRNLKCHRGSAVQASTLSSHTLATVTVVFFFPIGEKEYLDILSIGIIKSCLLELILADRSEGKERESEKGWIREMDAEKESGRAVMSAPRGDERPPVSRLLYRQPPFLSPPLTLPGFPSLPRSFSSVSLAYLLSPTYSISPHSSFFFFLSLKTSVYKHAQARACVETHTDTHEANLFVQSQKQKVEVLFKWMFTSSTAKMCVFVSGCTCVCMCVRRKRGNGSKHASLCVCMCVC